MIGAKQALEKIREQSGRPEVEAPETKTGSLAESVANLRKRIGSLKAKEAAEAWLTLYDEWTDLDADQMELFGGLSDNSFSVLMQALPDPDTWAELSRQIDARRKTQGDSAETISLSVFGHRLIGEMKRVEADVAELDKVTAKKPAAKGGIASLIGSAFGTGSEEQWKREQLRSAVAALKARVNPASAIDTFRERLENFDPNTGGWLEVPDLVSLTTPENAEALLKKALLLKDVPLSFNDCVPFGSEISPTIKLARKVARANLKQITTPHWELCYGIGTADLYEAFSKLKSDFTGNDYSSAGWYILDLIIQGRTKEVTEFLVSHSTDEQDPLGMVLYYALEEDEYSEKIFDFLKTVLNEHPELPLWETFVSLGAQLGRSDDVLKVVEKTAKAGNLSATAKRTVQQVRADSLLAANRVEEAVSLKFEMLELLIKDRSPTANQEKYNTATSLALIGHLLKNDEWYQRASKIAEAAIISGTGEAAVDSDSMIRLMIERREFARAETLLISEIAKSARSSTGSNPFEVWYGSSTPLPTLARLYHRAGRSQDVMTLLTTAPWWNHSDIGTFLQNTYVSPYRSPENHSEPNPLPVPLIAAAALAETGRSKEARAIAEEMVYRQPSLDAAWALALKLTGDDFPKLAQDVYSRDAFEERPLIWLARFHLDRKNIKQAEIEVRKAIAIDPSDGEQPRGDRMRAYAILAEILQAKGDTDTADIFRGAIRAIRMAETADRLYAAGMLSRGIRMYRESLTHFADAYCIQSRLAVQLAEEGDLDGAAKHYERAFQLMPSSFGRVESHCFGCEGVFQGELAQDIAERVFTRLRTETPKNAQVHYLSGYLRMNQDRPKEAIAFFERAVELDPEYLNAWSKLAEAHQESGEEVPGNVRDNIAFNVLRLDPSMKHGSFDVSQVQDLARLWRVLASLEKQRTPRPNRDLLELPAAKKRQADMKKAMGSVWDGSDLSMQMELSGILGRVQFAGHQDLAAISSVLTLVKSP